LTAIICGIRRGQKIKGSPSTAAKQGREQDDKNNHGLTLPARIAPGIGRGDAVGGGGI
jgi:hypothetical protein